MTALRFLCLFSSVHLRHASFFSRQEGHWRSEIDQGECEFVPIVVDAELAALAASRLFAAATLLCHPVDLAPALAPVLRGGAASFAAAGVPFEVVAADAPVTVLAWLSEHAPELVPCCRADGEVRPESPSWWRERARRHLAAGGAAAGAAEPGEDLAAELRAFVARRGW
jgi:hypothetical protein